MADALAGKDPTATITDDATQSAYYGTKLFADGLNHWRSVDSPQISHFTDSGSCVIECILYTGVILNGIGPADTLNITLADSHDDVKIYVWGYTGVASDNSSVLPPVAALPYTDIQVFLAFNQPYGGFGWASSDFLHGSSSLADHSRNFAGGTQDGVDGGGGVGQSIPFVNFANPSSGGTPNPPWGFDNGDYYFLALVAPTQDDTTFNFGSNLRLYTKIASGGLSFDDTGLAEMFSEYGFFSNGAGNVLVADKAFSASFPSGAVDPSTYLHFINTSDIANPNSVSMDAGIAAVALRAGPGPSVPVTSPPVPGHPTFDDVVPGYGVAIGG